MPHNDLQDTLETRLRKVEAEKAGTYDKRTEHLDAAGKTLFINRLILEDSPYLLQHAHNPVNWYAWGDEAFAAAVSEHKPVFLSIGYSTCHWCHVMEVESFDNVEVASMLNAHFISIKMDREQFPDIDEVYMTGVQIISGQGGWPMSNFLLPNGKPFFGATYFPASAFMHLLGQINDAWHGKYKELEDSATQIASAVERLLAERKPAIELKPQLSVTISQAVLRREDRSFGGLAGAPKFPQEPLLLLLLDRVRRTRELETLAFIERALEGMGGGGIYDQVAGGFHRYSVDAQWLVPHFEKMMYNQSQLGLVYLQAWQLTHNPFFRRICEQTLNYVLRDMQLPEGGFYSATDADSEGEEGTFFTWSIEELAAELTAAELSLIRAVYDLSEDGNFEGSNILSLQNNLGALAVASDRENFYAELDAVLHKLYMARERRIHPLRDDKVIVAWSSAMITTLTRAAFALDNPQWLVAAERAFDLMWTRNVDANEDVLRLQRIYLAGAVSIAGQLEDYVNLTEAALVLFDVTDNSEYLQRAANLMSATIARFWDEEGGSFFLSPIQQSGPQLTRSRSGSDGATLSAVATALQNLIELQRRSALWQQEAASDLREKITASIAATIAAQSNAINDNPLSHPSLLRGIASHQNGSIENIQFAANGLAKVSIQRQPDQADQIQLRVRLQLQPGWHVTAPQAKTNAGTEAASFVPLQVRLDKAETCWAMQAVEYPPSTEMLENGPGPAVPIYTETTEFNLHLTKIEGAADALSATAGFCVRLQLCNDKNCLLPEEFNFRT